MPELPEVETVVRTLQPALLQARITAVHLARTDILDPPSLDLARALSGRTFVAIARRAKRIVFTLDDHNRFYIHLGMSGRITLDAPVVPIEPHTHLRITLASGAEMRFRDPRRFGGIWWLGERAEDEGLGPEPLSLTTAELSKRLAKTKRAIKNALLDQTLIAGLGNIYVDESLFTAGIHPLIAADRLTKPQITRLNRAIKATLKKAINHRGSTLRDYRDSNGDAGAFQNLHRVYGRANEPCPICKKPLSRIVVGGRSTHFCANCQRRR